MRLVALIPEFSTQSSPPPPEVRPLSSSRLQVPRSASSTALELLVFVFADSPGSIPQWPPAGRSTVVVSASSSCCSPATPRHLVFMPPSTCRPLPLPLQPLNSNIILLRSRDVAPLGASDALIHERSRRALLPAVHRLLNRKQRGKPPPSALSKRTN